MALENGKLVLINNTWVPAISSYTVSREDLDSPDSKRSDETGYLHRRRIREKVKKLHFVCKANETQLKIINGLISGEDSSLLELTFFNPYTATMETGEFYISRDEAKLLVIGNESFWQVTFNAIEY